jgi:hypothetical protein
MTSENRNVILAWLLCGLYVVSFVGGLVYYVSPRFLGVSLALSQQIIYLIPLFFGFVGALIISRIPRNTIGWLLMVPGLSIFLVVDAYLYPYIFGQVSPPSPPTFVFLLALWFGNWNWLLVVLPVLFIMVIFPTGRPIGPRWRWLIYFGVFIVAVFLLLFTIEAQITPENAQVDWSVPNPIGFLPTDQFDLIGVPVLILFPVWILLCVVSVFVRFRRARAVERQQIKWLFYAGVVFVLLYMPSFIGDTYSQPDHPFNLLFPFGLAAFPLAISIAILRYRLWDIDIIIRRTLQYALLTGLLALVYFGAVVVLQELFSRLTGETGSPLVTVISTLAIAALFTPLRLRTQDFIDRRFYRRKYDAEQTLAHFSAAARDDVDLENLSSALLGAVGEALQPELVELQLKKADATGHRKQVSLIAAGQV